MMQVRYLGLSVTSAALGLALATLPATGWSNDVELPQTLVWSTYDTGGAGHAQAVAISSVLRRQLDISMRVIPGRTEQSRLTPLLRDRVDFVSGGFDTYFAQEGVYDFATREQWGPQPVRMLMVSHGNASMGFATAPDLNIEHPRDVEGLRVAWVKGSPTMQRAIQAMLACGDLTWDDVQKVEVPGFMAAVEGFMNDDFDVYFTNTASATSVRVENSNRGLAWVPIPHDDDACWERVHEVGAHWVPQVATNGGALPPEGIEMANYPFPIIYTKAGKDEDVVYNMTKAMYTYFDEYKDAAPGATGFALENQLFEWVLPYHEGAVRYYKEIGVWTDAHQAHQERMVRRQEVLRDTWEETVARDHDSQEAFEAAWMRAREAALEAEGMRTEFSG